MSASSMPTESLGGERLREQYGDRRLTHPTLPLATAMTRFMKVLFFLRTRSMGLSLFKL
jgi:hypothetical protein